MLLSAAPAEEGESGSDLEKKEGEYNPSLTRDDKSSTFRAFQVF